MALIQILSLFSSLSFFGYVIAYFAGSKMKLEFKRFKLQKIGIYIIILEFLGALGLIVGLRFNFILIISSLGLALLMLAGLIVRIRLKDSFLVSFPAFFFMLLNALIFVVAFYLN
tara:strand:+ start:116 stop:460 length:345 start_codon:yes stop_codon:yes gene_type:complete